MGGAGAPDDIDKADRTQVGLEQLMGFAKISNYPAR